MPLLLIVALVAGFATAFTPCVLPVLPIALSAGATGGRRRPIGVAAGVVVSFTFAIVGLSWLIDRFGLPDDVLRTFAVVVLAAFGASLLVPGVIARFEAFLSRFGTTPRLQGEGFGSGFVLGIGLGAVYAPCAGPILASVAVASATQTLTADQIAVAVAYAVGSAAGLYLVMLGGRRLASRVMARTVVVQMALGLLMVGTAVAIAFDLDVRLQNAIASDLPDFLVEPTAGLEKSEAISGPLSSIRGSDAARERGVEEAESGESLPVLGVAPEFTDTQRWFNTPNGEQLTMAGLRGQVVLVDFWTYTCINCIRTLPYREALWEKYHRYGFELVGVHSPEFTFEKDAGNVADSIAQNGLGYPVVQDNNLSTWAAYRNQYWPAEYLVDAEGHVRYVHFGEGGYDTSEEAVRSLLAEAGAPLPGGEAGGHSQRSALGVTTPESYLGAARADRFTTPPTVGVGDYVAPATVPPDHLAYGGRWRITPESATAVSGAELDLAFGAQRVFLVMGSPGSPRDVRVLLDGKPISEADAGPDVEGGVARVGAQRLYRLVDLPGVERHTLTLRFAPGVSGYAFTFG